MAISPTVSQYQSILNNEDVSPTTLSFNKKFGELAYNSLNSKYPKLLNYVVTFKVVDSNLDTSSAIGVFIIKAGNELMYLPVVMSNNQIESIEMIYDKKTDAVTPLIQEVVNHIVNLNINVDNTTVKQPKVEDTRKVFQNMFTPPTSSKVMFASANLENLPNKVKEKIVNTLRSNKELLSKIASFYDVDVLVSKLSPKKEEIIEKRASFLEGKKNAVITVNEISKIASDLRRFVDKERIARKGYDVIKLAEEGSPFMDTAKLPVELINKFTIINWNSTSSYNGKGYLAYFDKGEIKQEFCVISGDVIITKKGVVSDGIYCGGKKFVIMGYTDDITEVDLELVGAKVASSINTTTFTEGRDNKTQSARVAVFYPNKQGTYKVCVRDKKVDSLNGFPNQLLTDIYSLKDINIQKIDDAVTINYNGEARYTFIPNMTKGYLFTSNKEVACPLSSYIYVNTSDNTSYINSYDALYKLVLNVNTQFKLVKDASDYVLINKTAGERAKFSSEVDFVRFLVEDLGLNKEAADTLLDSKEIVVFDKIAFFARSEADETSRYPGTVVSNRGRVTEIGGYTGQPANPKQDTQGVDYSNVNPDEGVMQDFAELGDPDLMDVGMLASIAKEDDIKVLLLDYIRSFEDTTTDLGKAILLFVLNEQELVNFYNNEEYNTLLSNIRKVFKILGKIVFDLREYTNM